ncbi:hypothetical protein BB561_000298 [Smittium simulii]|uniref:Dolichyl-phosphate-mannose--protein mannosyltransferase n=1 Tax=Smittium simulii TaxID=133385 RepID=A0A2T9YZY0_9FUNG|nr:hypothetical protein BB561_000298 [Smittium simulii]
MNDEFTTFKRRNKPLPNSPTFYTPSITIDLEDEDKKNHSYSMNRNVHSHPSIDSNDCDFEASYTNPSSSQNSKRLASAPPLRDAYKYHKKPLGLFEYFKIKAKENKSDFLIALALTIFAMFTRLYKISYRDTVTWDEAHFGKFGAYYINRTFYHDVHPPLAKMLVALAEVIAGHNGTFNFDSDNALCVISKFILLDQPLLFFTALSILCFAQFTCYRRNPFSNEWWIWLTFSGLSLGCVLSSKWIGLFCVATVGLATIDHLWEMYGKPAMPVDIYLNHWAARILCLICVPILVYLFAFYIHFLVLINDGAGAHHMSSNFQAGMIGHNLNAQPINVANNSTGRLRSYYPRAGLLHSHNRVYPLNDQHNQVTSYQSKEMNNLWRILLGRLGENSKPDEYGYFREGDILKFVHLNSSRTLRVISQPAPVTSEDMMVSCYNNIKMEDLGDSDMWELRFYKQQGKLKDKILHPMLTKFSLRNLKYDCILRTHTKKLPIWGYYQNEVTCVKAINVPKKLGDDMLWNVEEHRNTKLQNDNMRKYVKSNFLINFAQINLAMAQTNNGLVADKDKYNPIESSPDTWPFLYSPMRMVGWGDKEIKYYEIGNPILWWASSLLCFLFPIQYIISFIYEKRRKALDQFSKPNGKHKYESVNFRETTATDYMTSYGELNSKKYWLGAKLLWSGWFFHYFPFFLMGRVTYLHHYLPALYFALLFLAFQIDYFSRYITNKKNVRMQIFIFCAVIAGLVFLFFFPFTVGYDKPAKNLATRTWRKSWNVYQDLLEL